MSRLGVHGAVKDRLSIPAYGSNRQMPLSVFRQRFFADGKQVTEDMTSALRNGWGKPPIKVNGEDWALAFSHSALEDGECADCRGKGFVMRPWKEGKITLESNRCRTCKGTGKRSPKPKRQGSKE